MRISDWSSDVCSSDLARENGDHYNRAAANISHERTMTALKSALGPHYDLAALWDMHVPHEFETRDVDAPMATIVAEPHVNHIQTMTGGDGHRHLHHFYTTFVVRCNPADMPHHPERTRVVSGTGWPVRVDSSGRRR